MVTIAMDPSMRMVNASFPSSPMLSLTTRSVKSIQDSVPGGAIVIVVPSVKSESVATLIVQNDSLHLALFLPSAWEGFFWAVVMV